MPDLAAAASGHRLTAERLLQEGPLWPWISRFLWSPARDLHPSRRAVLLPGWPERVWCEPAALAHLSRHLLSMPSSPALETWSSADPAFRLALLPPGPLGVLACRLGLALHGGAADGLTSADARFLAERAPLYWRATPAAEIAREAAGWRALRMALGGQPQGVLARFEWKTPLEVQAGPPGSSGAMLTLAVRILKELEEPWSSLFVTSGY